MYLGCTKSEGKIGKKSNDVRVYLNVLYDVVLNRTRVILRKVSIQLINP